MIHGYAGDGNATGDGHHDGNGMMTMTIITIMIVIVAEVMMTMISTFLRRHLCYSLLK